MTSSGAEFNNLFAALHAAAGRAPGQTLLEATWGEHRTYEEFELRSVALSAVFEELGLGIKSRIAVEVAASGFVFEAVFAAARIGAAVLPLNPGYTQQEQGALLHTLEPDLLITLQPRHSTWRTVTSERLHRETQARLDHQREHLAAASAWWVADPELVCRFGVTSGSSGLPKIVQKTHANWLADGSSAARFWGLTSQDRVLSAQPLYYGDPFIVLNGCIRSGATALYVERFRSQDFFTQVRDMKASVFLTIGAMPHMLLNSAVSPAQREHSARAAFSVAIPPERHAELERRFNTPFREMYGTAEVGLVIGEPFDVPGHDANVGTGNLGIPTPGTQVRLIDSDGSVIEGPGTGLAEVRGPSVASHGYLGGEHTAFAPEGWYATGDYLTRLENGVLRYAGRAKDVVRRAGENISCQEVERALRAHPLVYEAAVIPREDPIRQEEVWAVVMLNAPATMDTAEVLDEHLATVLARHKRPRFYSFLDKLPMTPTERVKKATLREQLRGEAPQVDLGERAHSIRGKQTPR